VWLLNNKNQKKQEECNKKSEVQTIPLNATTDKTILTKLLPYSIRNGMRILPRILKLHAIKKQAISYTPNTNLQRGDTALNTQEQMLP
jgi:hypothetical protein